MDTVLIVGLILFFLVVNGAFFYIILRRTAPGEGKTENEMLLIQNQIQELARSLESKIGESSKHMHDSMRTQLGESGRLIKEITQELTHV